MNPDPFNLTSHNCPVAPEAVLIPVSCGSRGCINPSVLWLQRLHQSQYSVDREAHPHTGGISIPDLSTSW